MRIDFDRSVTGPGGLDDAEASPRTVVREAGVALAPRVDRVDDRREETAPNGGAA
ncbi:hypothetical protein [Halorubrum laminariae]|uniref:Uncharacterized protein n=1 Tax=Halorubrum laminariae TaxID=1433523 RepID=A0ABD6BX16_9EURY|nr:hypothetical protein [Halorubrum laminariae]